MSGFDTTKYAYKLQDGKSALDTIFGSDSTAVNESEMSILFPFAHGGRRDGVGDLLEVGGIKTDRHRSNPISLVDHGKQVSLPIGMCEDPHTGEYTVSIDQVNKVATAKTFFYQGKGLGTSCGIDGSKDYDHAVFCEQLFDLVAKKFIRAGSIGYQVIAARELYPDYQTGIPKGMHLLSVLMLEASIVVLPANQDTVIKMLSMKSICGKPTSFYLKKSLAPYAPPRKAQMGYEGGKALTPGDRVRVRRSRPGDKKNRVTMPDGEVVDMGEISNEEGIVQEVSPVYTTARVNGRPVRMRNNGSRIRMEKLPEEGKSMIEPAPRQNKVTSGADATNEAVHTTPAPFRKGIFKKRGNAANREMNRDKNEGRTNNQSNGHAHINRDVLGWIFNPQDMENSLEAYEDMRIRRNDVNQTALRNQAQERMDAVQSEEGKQRYRELDDMGEEKHFSALALYEKQLSEMEKAIHMPQTPLDITPTLEEIEEGIKALISACKKPRKRVLPNLKKVAKWKSFNQGDLVRVTFHDERGKKISKQNGIYESGEADHHFVDFGNGKPQRITPKSRAIVELSPASELGEVDDTTRDLSELPEAYYLKDMEGMSEGESAGMGEIGEKGSYRKAMNKVAADIGLNAASRAPQHYPDMDAAAFNAVNQELGTGLTYDSLDWEKYNQTLSEDPDLLDTIKLVNSKLGSNTVSEDTIPSDHVKEKKCMDCGNIKKRKRKKALSSYQRLKDKHSKQKDAIKELHNYIGELLQ